MREEDVMKAKKFELDQSKLLGFKLMPASGTAAGGANAVKTGSKVGGKPGKMGAKVGVKPGAVGTKPVSRRV